MSGLHVRVKRTGSFLLLSLAAVVSDAAAQATGTVGGLITDADTRQPIAAAQVYIQALDRGVLSQAGGRYTIPGLPVGVHQITVSRIGYRQITQTVTVAAGQTAIVDFAISEEALALDEIVITGTAGGTQRRAVGNSVEQLDVAAVREISPITTLEQGLGANVPGLLMQRVGGAPGGDGSRIRIRGSSSQALTNEPIVFIDGVRMYAEASAGGEAQGVMSRLDDIDPNDIQSIEVIKGPAAATLYGTEASNGVIQIITRRGQAGAPVFDMSLTGGSMWFHNPTKWFGSQYGAIAAPTDPTRNGRILQMNIYESESRRIGYPLVNAGKIASADFSVQGGTDQVRYYGSVGRNYRQGVRSYNEETLQSMRTSLSFLPREELDVRVNLGYTTQDLRMQGQEWYDVYWSAPQGREFEGGNPNPLLGFFRVPPEERKQEEQTLDRTRTNFSFEVNYRPVSWLANRLVFGSDVSFEQEGYTLPRQLDGTASPFWGQNGDGVRDLETRRVQLNTADYSGTVTLPLIAGLSSATAFGFQYYSKTESNHESQGDDFATAALTTVTAAGLSVGTESFLENTTVGMYAQEQLDLNQRIFLTGAVRMDDNSAFGANYEAAVYPKVSATWVVSEEPFFNIAPVSTLRLRSAWGRAGKQPDIFASRQLFAPAVGIGNTPILVPTSLGNPDLGPEIGSEFELGFDAAFFDQRVDLQHTNYWKSTKDAIITRQIAPSVGVPGTQLVNVGEIRSWGSETALNVQALTEDPIRWDLGFSLAIQKNRIEDLGGISQISVRRARYHIEGYPLASLFGYNIRSADFVSGGRGPTTNEICDGGTGPGNHDQGGVDVPCATAPLVFYAPGEPTWLVNMTSTWTLFEDWQLFATIDGQGGHMQSEDAASACHTTVLCSLMAALRTDPIWSAQTKFRRQGTTHFKGGWMKLRQIGLTYQLPEGIVGRMGADRASFQLGLRDIATLWQQQEWTDWGIRIPEPEGSMPTEQFGGEARHRPPNFMTMTATLRVTF